MHSKNTPNQHKAAYEFIITVLFFIWWWSNQLHCTWRKTT